MKCMLKYSACIKCQLFTCLASLLTHCFYCDPPVCGDPRMCVCHSRGSLRSPEVPASNDQDDPARLEAERKLEELKRRRDDAESEEFERMRQRQQEAEAELEELKRKREERRKVLEEEERQKQQEEAEKKAREEVEGTCFFHSLIILTFPLRFLPSQFFPDDFLN